MATVYLLRVDDSENDKHSFRVFNSDVSAFSAFKEQFKKHEPNGTDEDLDLALDNMSYRCEYDNALIQIKALTLE